MAQAHALQSTFNRNSYDISSIMHMCSRSQTVTSTKRERAIGIFNRSAMFFSLNSLVFYIQVS